MDLLSFPLTLIVGYSFLFGLFIGSFLHVLSDRLPREETILGRSHCERCAHTLSSSDLIPVFSFILLQGKCRYCKAPISWYNPFAEILTGILFAVSSYLFITFVNDTNVVLLIVYLAIVACLIVILLADLKFHIIPDEIQIALFFLSLATLFINGLSWNAMGLYIISGFIVMLPILLLFIFTKGRGMGFGDVKYALIMGYLLGWAQGLVALYIGFVSGAIVGSILILMKKTKMKSKIAFGPFLVLGTYLMLFFGDQILEVVKRFYGI